MIFLNQNQNPHDITFFIITISKNHVNKPLIDK